MKKINDEICESHGLSVCVKGKHFDGSDIDEGTIRSYDKKDYRLMTTDGKKSLKTDCISAVHACMAANLLLTTTSDVIVEHKKMAWA